MGESGWICLHRKLQENFLWRKARVFSEAEAWIDILLTVQYSRETKEVMIGMTVLECGYGQSLKSIATWAARWTWTESKVRRFLNLLKDRRMIETENVRKSTRLTVCNFDTYNNRRRQSEVKVTSKRRVIDDRQQREQGNKVNNKEKEAFDEARRLYPGKKRGLDTEWDNFRKKHKDYREVCPDLVYAIKIETAERKADKARGEFVPSWKNFQTWINKRWWEAAENAKV